MEWSRIGYGLLCLILPVAWGLLIYAISTAIERRVLGSHTSATDSRSDQAGKPTELPLDYHI